MYIIKDYNKLTEDEINHYISNFNPTQIKDKVKPDQKVYGNEYTKQSITPSTEFIEEIKTIIRLYFPNYNLRYYYTRLNNVSKDTNPSDGYHTDSGTGNIIFLHYPISNPNFTGGEFEWKDVDDTSHIIEIKNGMNLILVDNPPHRVLNVTEGERWSFACFFDRYERGGII